VTLAGVNEPTCSGGLHMLKRVVFVVGALSALGACVATRSNTANNTLARAVLVGKAPHWSASSADGRLAFVTNEGSNDVAVVDVESRTVAATIAGENAPRKIAVQPIPGTDATTETTVRTNTARAETGKSLVIDGVSYANHGTKDVRNLSKLELEADDYYFSPTFLRGKPGQKLTLLVESEARTLHNLSISSLGIDKDILPKGKVRLEVTFPASGVLAFTCKFHGGLGMNGQLLTGDGRPLGAR
jgi:YVTN family beta-propeller protein